MKILTVLGTRPEIIRLSRIIPLLDNSSNHILVNTCQNYDPNLNEIFFKQLKLRKPNYFINSQSNTPMQEIGIILAEIEKIIIKEDPSKMLILGDTNSGLSAFVAKRYQIPVYHMEAGNRAYDCEIPEEVNRKVIDSCTDIFMPYTERSRYNLLKEGYDSSKIYVIGNPINEVLNFYTKYIDKSNILNLLNLKTKNYFLITLHRAENVDNKVKLEKFIKTFILLTKKYNLPIIWPIHPRTYSKVTSFFKDLPIVFLKDLNIDFIPKAQIICTEPLGLFDFVKLEKNASCVLTDSGTVQEECCILKVPCVILRKVTERPETLETGGNILAGCSETNILKAVKLLLKNNYEWRIPPEYNVLNVSETVVKLVIGHY